MEQNEAFPYDSWLPSTSIYVVSMQAEEKKKEDGEKNRFCIRVSR